MRKISLIAAIFAMIMIVTGCTKSDKTSGNNAELIVGRWKSVDKNYYEVYKADGTGKMWNEDDDVSEDEADTFTWSFLSNDNTKFTQIIHFQSGAAELPQSCNIVTLNEKNLVYNNNGWRREENLKRVN